MSFFERRSLFTLAGALACGVSLAGSPALASGQATYSSRCSMCHQTDGAGLAGQFPRLAGRVDKIAGSPAGRTYLAHVLLYGMYGSITVDGKSISGLMPPMGSLSDQDIADVLNTVVSLKKPTKAPASFTAAEIAKVRAGDRMNGTAVGGERSGLAGKGLIP